MKKKLKLEKNQYLSKSKINNHEYTVNKRCSEKMSYFENRYK